MDIRQKLLDAFAIEHKQHLAVIRSVLDLIEQHRTAPSTDKLAEIHRAAHSLKGAARVCDLTAIEAVAQQLEYVLARLRDGKLSAEGEFIPVIRECLDAIETASDAGLRQQELPDLQPSLKALEQLLGRDSPSASPAPRPSKAVLQQADPAGLKQRILAAFQVEHREHLEAIRAVLDKLELEDSTLTGEDIDEIFRRAHSLKGAARVNELHDIETLAHRLETLFGKVRDGELAPNPEVLEVLKKALDVIEDAANAALAQKAPPHMAGVLARIEEIIGVEPAAASGTAPEEDHEEAEAGSATGAHGLETLRLSAGNLDRILYSARELLTECLQQDQVGRKLVEVGHQIADLDREWEAVRRASGARLHQMQANPENFRISQYLGFVEQQVRALSKCLREARTLHKDSNWSLTRLGTQLQQEVRTARMVPADDAFQGIRKIVRDVAADEGKEVQFRVTGLATQADRMVLQALKDPLMHLLRNAVSHGIEPAAERGSQGKSAAGQVSLRIETSGNRLRLIVEDDGRGIDYGRVAEVAIKRGLISQVEAETLSQGEIGKLIFQSQFSTSRVITQVSGRGVGLSVVSNSVARLQGEVLIQPSEGPGTTFLISVPLSLATYRLILVECEGRIFGIPFYGIEQLVLLKAQDISTMEGNPVVHFQELPVPLRGMAHLLKLGEPAIRLADGLAPVVILRSGNKRLALAVDRLLDQRDAILKDLPGPTSGNPKLIGAFLLEDGTAALVLNPSGLIESFAPTERVAIVEESAIPHEREAPTILVVDDSFTTRTLEKSLLEANGYKVVIAVDGVEGLEKLRAEDIDLAIIDVQMPRMDGFTMLEHVKKDKALKETPVIMVTSMESRSDIERGLGLGAEAYIVKRKFDHQELLDTIRQIL